MIKRIGIITLLVVIGLWVVLATFRSSRRSDDGGATAVPAETKANLILITVDGLRADRLGAYGAERSGTAYLNGLARAGVVFEDVLSHSPHSLPSHASLMTGRLPPEHGLRAVGMGRLPPEMPTLADKLRSLGYLTGAFLANPLLGVRHGLDHGFNRFDEGSEPLPVAGPLQLANRDAVDVLNSALQWLESVWSKDSAPFFAWVQLSDPLPPRQARSEIFGDFFSEPYDAELAYLDMQIGRLFEWLERNELKSSTLVVLAGAHGEGLPGDSVEGHGFLLDDVALHVPLLMALPGRLPAGRRVSGVVGLSALTGALPPLLGLDASFEDEATRRLVETALGEAEGFSGEWVFVETALPYTEFGWAPLRGLFDDVWGYVQGARPKLTSRRSGERAVNVVDSHPDIVAPRKARLAAWEAKKDSRLPFPPPLAADDVQRLALLGYPDARQAVIRNAWPGSDIELDVDVWDRIPTLQRQQVLREQFAAGATNDQVLAEVRLLVDASSPESPGIPSRETSRFRHWLGNLHLARGETDSAMTMLLEAVENDREDATLNRDIARGFHRQGRMPEAITYYEQAWVLNPGDVGVRQELSDALLQTGVVFSRAKRFEAARWCLERHLSLEPDSPSGQLNLALIDMAELRYEEAEAALRNLLERYPQNEAVQRNLEVIRDRRSETTDQSLTAPETPLP